MKYSLTQKLLALIFLLFLPFIASAKDTEVSKGTLKGKILTEDNKPAENVSVRLKGTKYGTTTDEYGEFQFRAPAATYILVVSHTGFQTQEISVTVNEGRLTEIPQLIIRSNSNSLAGVHVYGSKTNKFTRKSSDDVAKMPLSNLENPQVYNTIGKELMTEQQLFSVDDAIKNAPGIQTMWQATGRGGDGGAYYNSRGFILQSTFRDGIAGVVTSTNDAVNIERIEVIKGPSATLFGSTLTSFGGLINRVTKKPYDSFGGEIAYSAGSYGLNRVSADINTPLDSAKKLLFRLNTAFNYQGSFQYNGFSRNYIAAPSLSYKINDKLSISLSAELSYGKNSSKPIFFFLGSNVSALGTNNANGLELDYKQTYSNSDLDQNSRSTNYFAQVNYKISDQWTSRTNFSSSGSYSNGFSPYFYLLAKDTIYREDQSTKNSKNNIIEIQQNFNGDFKIGGLRNRLVLGLDYFHQNSDQHFFGGDFDEIATNLGKNAYGNFNYVNLQNIYNTPGGIQFTYPLVFKANTYSAYVSDVLNITDRLMVLASLRMDHYDNQGGVRANTPTPRYTQNAYSPKFGLVYEAVEKQVSLFANYQNGFINPGSYNYHINGTPADSLSTRIAKIQNARQIEGGVKLDLFDGKLSSTVSYYNIQLTNVLRPDPNSSAYGQLQDGTQLSKGVEAEIIANPVRGLNLIAGFSYNDSKYTKADSSVQGRRPSTASAPYTVNFYASYRFHQEPLRGLGLGFGGNYVSTNQIINSSTQGVFSLPAYTIFNASTFYERSRYRVNLSINNLTNKEYYIGYTTVNPQMLRQVVASVAFKF